MMRTPRFGESLVCCRLVFLYGAAGCVGLRASNALFDGCFWMKQQTAVEWRLSCSWYSVQGCEILSHLHAREGLLLSIVVLSLSSLWY